MSEFLQRLCERLSSRIHWWVGYARERGAKPRAHHFLHKYLILFGLEDCQSVLRRENDHEHLWCRFSMDPDDKDDLDRFLANVRADLLMERFNKIAAASLEESLVDFSMSNYSLDEANGGKGPLSGANGNKFRLRLIAESEMDSSVGKLAEDLLKLTCVKAPFKICLFKAATKKRLASIIARCEQLLTNALQDDDAAEWLFVGLPSYEQWVKYWSKPTRLKPQVFTYERQSGRMVAQYKWWSWDDSE